MIYFQSFEEIISALRRRTKLIIVIALLGCLASVVFALTRPAIYSAIAVVQIEDAQVSGTNSSSGTTTEIRSSLDARRTVGLIEQRVMSRGTLTEVMEKYDLFSSDKGLTPTERIVAMRRAVTIEPILSGEAWQPSQAVSGMVIYVDLDDAQKAADVANDLMDRVLEEARIRSVDRAQFELEFFNSEEARIREEIVAAEALVADFKSAHSDVLPSNIIALQGELTTLNGALISLRQQVLSLETNSGRTRAESLERQITVLQNQINLIEERITEINGFLYRAPAVERELVALERDQTQLNEQFTVISRRKVDAEMSQSLEEQRQLARFEVLERALAPVYPVSRSKRSIAILGAIASIMGAVCIAFGLEMLNPAIRNASQMERALGVRPVISVPMLATTSNGPKKGKGTKSKFGFGVAVAVLMGLVVLVAKPLGELAGISVAQRKAQ